MSKHGKHARPRQQKRRLAAILPTGLGAAVALAGASVAMTPAAQASVTVTPQDNEPHAITLVKAAVQQQAGPQVITVAVGQSLAAISQAQCGTASDWTGIYAASRKAHQTAWNANNLEVGQHLTIQCYSNPGMTGRAYTPPPLPPVVQQQVAVTTTASVSPPPVYHQSYQHSYQQPAVQHTSSASTSTGGYPGGSFGACVVQRESGGNPQVMNSSGHYGLYQFSESTWEAYGGSASSFGNASVAQQEQVFSNALAQGGQSNWSPYDGC